MFNTLSHYGKADQKYMGILVHRIKMAIAEGKVGDEGLYTIGLTVN